MIGEILEKGQKTVTSSVKTVASDVVGQLGVKGEASPDNSGVKSQTQAKANTVDETKQFVKEFYAPSTDLPENITPDLKQKMQDKDKLETQQKLNKLRQELHKGVYYEPLIAYETKKPEEQEEPVAEKVKKQEQEEEQKKMKLEQKKAQEKQDIATARAKIKVEANRGVAG